MRAVEQKQCPRVVLGGGVAASHALRAELRRALGPDGDLFAPSQRLATDNAAMIARAALFHYERGNVAGLAATARADLPFPGLRRAQAVN
jgi:N6-L-threonylcarbamoyladenine synthase